jgi:hypothetical protein
VLKSYSFERMLFLWGWFGRKARHGRTKGGAWLAIRLLAGMPAQLQEVSGGEHRGDLFTGYGNV